MDKIQTNAVNYGKSRNQVRTNINWADDKCQGWRIGFDF